jgi:hypothetical protein
MEVNTLCKLANFRWFMIMSTSKSFFPQNLLRDEKVFPEREKGTMYVEAEDKVSLLTIREIKFVRVSEVLGIIYNSKSGRTKLKWRSLSGDVGRLTGEVTVNSLTNLFAAEILNESDINTNKLKG